MTDLQPSPSSTAVPLRSRLHEKLPEILIEAASIVFVLLLAFAANSWHQHAQQADAAARAHRSIIAELQSNRDQLRATQASVDKAIKHLQQVLASLSGQGKIDKHVNASISTWLPSSAAWNTALATGVTTHMDYAWVMKVARIEELQSLFTLAQRHVIWPPPPAPVRGMEKPGSPVSRMAAKYQVEWELINMRELSSFGASLEQNYDSLLHAPQAKPNRKPASHS